MTAESHSSISAIQRCLNLTADHRGSSSLMGILFSLMISVVPMLLLARLSESFRQTRATAAYYRSVITAQQYAGAVTRSLSSNLLPLLPRIHSGGMISLTSGTVLRISQTPALAADGVSDALSWVDILETHAMSIRTLEAHGSILEADACFIFSRSMSLPAEVTGFLAVTRDGIYEMNEASPHTTFRAPCLKLTMRVSESVIADPLESFFAPGLQMVLPIEQLASLYRDTAGSLRLISHSGTSIRENQPVQRIFPLFRLLHEQLPEAPAVLLMELHSPNLPLAPAKIASPWASRPPAPLTLAFNSVLQ